MDKRDENYFESDEFQSLVSAEIGRSAMPRDIAAQRILQKYGARPDATSLTKMAKARGDFEEVVTGIQGRDRCSRMVAMRKARQEAPAEFQRYQET
jgi:hypothetical protein